MSTRDDGPEASPATRQQHRQDDDKVIIRLPDGMRDAIKASAKKNNRSANAEIVSRIGDGMTLRDWFAGQALGALLRIDASEGTIIWAAVADEAYSMADAMLAARAQPVSP